MITFPKPLTLIVGRNGSGKTVRTATAAAKVLGACRAWRAPPRLTRAGSRRQTIIECLKHAVTGEWPPNSHSGKSFVHDPKARRANLLREGPSSGE